MTIEIIKGDLLDALDRGDVDVIGHVVNCQGKMNSGIAKSIRERYPIVYDEYLKFHNYNKLSKWLLGSSQIVPILVDKTVFNLFGQQNYGYDGQRYLNYGAISNALHSMSKTGITKFDYELGKSSVVGFPYKMGCDRAGGDWNIVLEMIEYHFKDHTVKIYQLESK